MRNVITIRSGIPGTKAYRKPEDLFSEKEIDRMDASIRTKRQSLSQGQKTGRYAV